MRPGDAGRAERRRTPCMIGTHQRVPSARLPQNTRTIRIGGAVSNSRAPHPGLPNSRVPDGAAYASAPLRASRIFSGLIPYSRL